MARENQGLQITLIIFIILTLMLSVTTFFFYKGMNEQTIKTVAAEKAKSDAEASARDLLEKNNKLKTYINLSYDSSMTDDAVNQQFLQDMILYAENLPSSEQAYQTALQDLYTNCNQALAAKTAANDQLAAAKAAFDQAQKDMLAQLDQYKAELDKAKTDLTNEKQSFANYRTNLNGERDKMLATNTQLKTSYDSFKTQAANDAKLADEKLTQASGTIKAMSSTLDDLTDPSFEVPDGIISYVSQKENTVWINLGSLDGLRRGTTFSVYSPNTNDVTEDKSKGSIEVTQIIGEHLAQARIQADEMANPIMPKDLVYTPLWAPGNVLSFALTNGMDVDGDGTSDIELIRNLIAVNGGVVDCYVDEDKKEIVGAMKIETRFMVVGELSNENTDPEIIDLRTRMQDEAERLGIKTISFTELLDRMGFKEAAPVITYGDLANPADFRAKPEGIPQASSGRVTSLFAEQPESSTGKDISSYSEKQDRNEVSSGTVSELFRKRTPPTWNRGSAFE